MLIYVLLLFYWAWYVLVTSFINTKLYTIRKVRSIAPISKDNFIQLGAYINSHKVIIWKKTLFSKKKTSLQPIDVLTRTKSL